MRRSRQEQLQRDDWISVPWGCRPDRPYAPMMVHREELLDGAFQIGDAELVTYSPECDVQANPRLLCGLP